MKRVKYQFEADLDPDFIEIEDSGSFLSFDFYDENGMQFQLSSVEESSDGDVDDDDIPTKGHEIFRQFLGRKIKVTIETID